MVIPSLQKISKIVDRVIYNSKEIGSSISLPSIISLEEFSAYLHFELLRSAVFRKMSTKPFRSFLIKYGMLMYGREAQSKTKTASPATIPKSGERNRKIHSCMLYLISI